MKYIYIDDTPCSVPIINLCFFSRCQLKKKCAVCEEKIGVASKTCHHCGAKQPLKEKLQKKKKKITAGWKERQKKNCSFNKTYDSSHLLVSVFSFKCFQMFVIPCQFHLLHPLVYIFFCAFYFSTKST